MAHPIVRLLGLETKRVVGLTAGASPGGIDAALCEVTGWGAQARARLLRFSTVPFPPGLGEAVEELLDPSHPTSAAELSTVSFRLGHAFAEAAAQLAGDDPVDLVGSHGQTVWHQPPWMKQREDLIASTLQLGEPSLIAARTGAVTVADFRVADMAVAGEGAPLGPYVDWALYRLAGGVRALQDLGGIASVTVVGERLAEVFTFDTGPGTLIIDAMAARARGTREAAQDDQALLARGRVLPALLARLLDDDYLRQPPPKSTGRERYGRGFVRELIEREAGADPLDLLATTVAFVAESVAQGYRAFVLPRVPVSEVLLSGGGARNPTLQAHLARLLAPLPVRELDAVGVRAEAREAVAVAVLAVEAIHASPANVPVATGARREAVLGKICLPPP